MEKENKPWQIVASAKEDYLSLECTGALHNTEDLLTFASDLYVEIEKYGIHKILNNMITMEVQLSITSYYSLVESYMNDYPPSNHLLKIAVIMNAEYQEQGSFWEAVCNNRGFDYMAFSVKDDALNWLKSK